MLPADMREMAETLTATLLEMGGRLMQLGLGYLTLDRSSASLSTGERQRAQLARAVRNETTGVLYVLDEPSTGLHPANIEGLIGVMHDLLVAGNSVVFVDHDVRVLRAADRFIEMGPGAGREGGRVVAQGTPDEIAANPDSRIAGFLTGREPSVVRERTAIPPLPSDWTGPVPGVVGEFDGTTDGVQDSDDVRNLAIEAVSDGDAGQYAIGGESATDRTWLRMATAPIHTVRALDVAIPRGRLTAVTGVSGSGKTTMILESLVPAIEACTEDRPLPAHVTSIDPAGIDRVRIVDSTPIGINVRSTLATYSGVMDMLRRAFAATDAAKARGFKLADFSYNTGSLRCPQCDGTGRVDLDIQFLPDVTIPCPSCEGRRYRPEADAVRLATPSRPRGLTMPQMLALSVDEALAVFDSKKDAERAVGSSTSDDPTSRDDVVRAGSSVRDADAVPAGRGDLIAPTLCRRIHAALETLSSLGLGYLTLGEDTPSLSGGEAQRLKLSNELGRRQHASMFVLDEPTTGLHPLDVRTLIGVLQRLLDGGATIVVIEHDLDMIANADFVIDMGPGGGEDGGRIVAVGTPEDIADNPDSLTGRYLKSVL